MKKISILEEQLLDEYFRCERNLNANMQELKKLGVRGYLFEKVINGKAYYYIRWKKGKKIKSKYVKVVDEEIKEKYRLKAIYKSNIRALKHDLKILKRAPGSGVIEEYRSEFQR